MTQDKKNITIIKLPDHMSMSGDFRFAFGYHGEKFNDIVGRLDLFIIELRNLAVKGIASEVGMDVKFEE